MKINLKIMIIPLVIILLISTFLVVFPTQSSEILGSVNTFLTEKLGVYYLIVGLGFFAIAIYLAFSKRGMIKLGSHDSKPKYSNWAWGTMIFTSTMAADILFYALHEWSYYYSYGSTVQESEALARTYPLFHWGFIPWSFYLVPAVAYAFMMFVKKRKRETMSEACRPILGKHSDGVVGHVIDIVAIVGLLAGTATTFSIATPLLSTAFCYLTGIPNSKIVSVVILLVIALIYTIIVLNGFKGMSWLAKVCTIAFCTLLGIFLIGGNPVYILESGFSGIGSMVNDFVELSTWTDPVRYNSIPQSWTIFYWAYWIAWCVANPFFIAKISEGRTIRNTVVGGFIAGLLGTFASFIIFGGFGQYQQHLGNIDVAGILAEGVTSPADLIIQIIQQLPFHQVAIAILVITMIGLYSTTFDALTHVVANFCHKEATDSPKKKVIIYWAVVFLMLPIALIFSEQTNSMLMTVSIIGALPISIILILVVISFFKSSKLNVSTFIDSRRFHDD